MKGPLAIPYKIICVALVGLALVLGGVLAVGVPAHIVSLLQ